MGEILTVLHAVMMQSAMNCMKITFLTRFQISLSNGAVEMLSKPMILHARADVILTRNNLRYTGVCCCV